MQKVHLSVAIPSSVLENCDNLRSKTLKIGQIARACAIYRVREIIIYSIDKITSKKYFEDTELIAGILDYLDCPQYLRRIIFPMRPMFKYIGSLPPLRTPHHPLIRKIVDLKSDSIREGVVLSSNNHYSEIEIGLKKPIKIKISNLLPRKRVILKLKKRGTTISGVPIEKTEIEQYWGYTVKIFNESIKKFITRFSNYKILATSKKGTLLKRKDIELLKKLGENDKIVLMFGSPSSGLFEIFKKNGLKLEEWVEFIINITAHQGTQTIRVEEALISTLAIVSCLMTL